MHFIPRLRLCLDDPDADKTSFVESICDYRYDSQDGEGVIGSNRDGGGIDARDPKTVTEYGRVDDDGITPDRDRGKAERATGVRASARAYPVRARLRHADDGQPARSPPRVAIASRPA